MKNQNKDWEKEAELINLRQAVLRLTHYIQTHNILDGVKEDLTFVLKKAEQCTKGEQQCMKQ